MLSKNQGNVPGYVKKNNSGGGGCDRVVRRTTSNLKLQNKTTQKSKSNSRGKEAAGGGTQDRGVISKIENQDDESVYQNGIIKLRIKQGETDESSEKS